MSNGEDLKRINDVIAERFNNIEDRVTSAQTIAELFENLIEGVEKEFGVPFVWLSLVNSDNAGPVIAGVRESDFLDDRHSVVSPELLDQILAGGMKPVLANKDLLPFYRLLPPNRKYFVRSIAVVPFTLNGQLIGTWNNGDADENRYESDMKTDFIETMAGHVSRKLTQLVAGEKNEYDAQGGLHD